MKTEEIIKILSESNISIENIRKIKDWMEENGKTND